MLSITQVRPSTKAKGANFPVPVPVPIPIPVPSFVKEQYLILFNGATYSPFEPNQVEQVACQLLDFATERFLHDSYHTFVLTVLADYPEFKLDPFDALDSAMLTAYSEGFLHASFPEALWLIREWQQIKLDYANPRLLSLLQTLYEWSCDHARHFRDAHQEVFNRYMVASPATPGYAFIMTCAELDLALEHWIAREPSAFHNTFGPDFPRATGPSDEALAGAIRQDLAILPAISLPESEVA